MDFSREQILNACKNLETLTFNDIINYIFDHPNEHKNLD